MASQVIFSTHAGLSSAKFFIVLLCASAMVAGCLGQAMPFGETSTTASMSLRSLITETGEVTRQYVESIVGTNVVETALEFLGMLLQFLAEGAASGLNVIAVYVSEILRATGVDAKLPFPHFTPEGVASVAKWALLALIGYWVLSVVLRLALSVLRRVFWLLKAVATLWMFGLIVSDTSAATDTTAMRLAALVLSYVVIGLATGSKEAPSVESRLNTLEGKLKAIEKKKMD
ncbi:voltage-gated monoatomic cation channel TMEM109 isoform X2 [Sardina pilchardus]|uniref:voltage-gated monoatomic cation channel TMEM109 isoform X2 n=1 Tax=Sardina pilchardus TaxID=27697 RepID=UPI002E121034